MTTPIIDVLFSETQIQQRVSELGQTITEAYRGDDEPLVVITLMKGAVIFSADLVRQIKHPLILDYMIVSSYGDETESSGELRVIKDLQESVRGKHVLIVDDIVDSGNTMYRIISMLKTKSPKSIKSCTLLNKPSRRTVSIEPDYAGFDVEDLFVIGYGLDYAQLYRELPYVGVLNDGAS